MPDKILLVDDEPGIRHVLKIALMDLGYSVITADSGDRGWALFVEHQPPVVITDIKMPGMDGLQLLERIKAHAPSSEVIMITGHGDMNSAVESLKRNAADFITKPINTDVLAIAIDRALEKAAMRRELDAHTANLERLVEETSAKLVADERRRTTGQVVDGLFTIMADLSPEATASGAAFDSLPCFVSVHNPDHTIVAANQFFREHLPDYIGGQSDRLYAPDTDGRPRSPAADAFRTGALQRSVETLTVDAEPVPVVVYALPVRDGNGTVDQVVEVASELSDLSELQQDLRAVQERYHQLFDDVPCYISVQNRALRLVEINRQFVAAFGDHVGEHCYTAYKHRDQPCTDCPVVKTFADGQSHQAETVVTDNAGQSRNVLITTAPIRNRLGEITQVMEVSTDITQIRQLHSHLESLGLMIGSVSHNIKGLLTGLDGGLYLLDSGIKDTEIKTIRDGREIIGQSARRIKSMVLDILFYTKERPLHPEDVDVIALAEDLYRGVQRQVAESAIAVNLNAEPAAGVIAADAAALQSALSNILENAVDAVQTTTGAQGTVTITATGDAGTASVAIADTGPGMDAETHKRLFDMFYSTKGNRGTGLGLFVAKKIIDRHHGRIDVATTLGRGSTVTVTLPRIQPEPE